MTSRERVNAAIEDVLLWAKSDFRDLEAVVDEVV
jgi:hypothetical protein